MGDLQIQRENEEEECWPGFVERAHVHGIDGAVDHFKNDKKQIRRPRVATFKDVAFNER